MDLALVIDRLVPGADYRRADDLATLTATWVDARPIPSKKAISAAWAEIQAEQASLTARKVWPSAGDFWDEFNDDEKYDIEVSVDRNVVILRSNLKLWFAEVWSDDPRIVGALAYLESIGILTAERKAEILAK